MTLSPELAAAVHATRRRESLFTPELVAIPHPIAEGLAKFADFVSARLGLSETPPVKFFAPRAIDVHSGLWLEHDRIAWVAAKEAAGIERSARDMAVTLAHEFLHAKGIEDEETCFLEAVALLREYERIPLPTFATVPTQAPQFFGGF